MQSILGVPASALLIVVGALLGVLMGRVSRPRWSALPAWFPAVKGERGATAHAAYGAVAAALGGIVVSIADALYEPWVIGGEVVGWTAVAWMGAVAGASAVGASPQARRSILAAHASVLLGIVGVAFVVYAVIEWWLRDWCPVCL